MLRWVQAELSTARLSDSSNGKPGTLPRTTLAFSITEAVTRAFMRCVISTRQVFSIQLLAAPAVHSPLTQSRLRWVWRHGASREWIFVVHLTIMPFPRAFSRWYRWHKTRTIRRNTRKSCSKVMKLQIRKHLGFYRSRQITILAGKLIMDMLSSSELNAVWLVARVTWLFFNETMLTICHSPNRSGWILAWYS